MVGEVIRSECSSISRPNSIEVDSEAEIRERSKKLYENLIRIGVSIKDAKAQVDRYLKNNGYQP